VRPFLGPVCYAEVLKLACHIADRVVVVKSPVCAAAALLEEGLAILDM